MSTYLGHIFNEEQSKVIAQQIGTNLSQLKIFTESMIDAEKPDITKHIMCEIPEFEGEYAKFCYKLNSVYLRPEVQHLFDEGVLDYAVSVKQGL